MKIAITGSTGFLGIHLCKRLIKEGHSVVGIGRNEEIGEKLNQFGVNFINADLTSSIKIHGAIKDVDQVIHSGALSSPWGKRKDFYDTNVNGTKNVINACIKNNVKRIIHVSTPSVYFNFKDRYNIKETDPVASDPPSQYTKTKLEAEHIVMEAAQTGLEVIILRPRGLFGPGDTAIIPRLLKAKEKGKLPIIGNGNNIVDLTYIDNAVEAVYKSVIANKDATGQIYNITNGEPVKLWDFINKLFIKSGKSPIENKVSFSAVYAFASLSEIIHRTILTKKEPTLTRYTAGLLAKSQTLNIDKAKEKLNYKPIVSLEAGLNKVIEEIKNGN